MFLPSNTVLRRTLPRQIPLTGFAVSMAENGESATTTTQAVMAGNLVLQLFLSASLNYLWAMINTQQIILMMPLFNLALPANAALFFGFLMQIASFDIIPTDIFYNDVLNWVTTDPVNENFNSVGFGTTLFIYNIGSMIIFICTYPVLVFVYLVLRYCCESKKKSLADLKRKRN